MLDFFFVLLEVMLVGAVLVEEVGIVVNIVVYMFKRVVEFLGVWYFIGLIV